MAEVRVMVKGRPPKVKFDFYVDPADLDFMETAVQKGWVPNYAEFLRLAIRHYKDISRAINEAADEARAAHCAWLKKRIYGDGVKRDAAESKPS